MKKYSIIFPYYKRAGQLHNSLISFQHHYSNRNDYEIIIVEDIKNYNNQEEHEKVLKVLKFFTQDADKVINIKLIKSDFNDCYNPAPLFNLGVQNSNGEYLIITNPEIFHKDNILSACDEILFKHDNPYIVFSCLNVDEYKENILSFEEFTFKPKMWYQHLKYRNALFHFCSCLSKRQYQEIGGFDERYSSGVAYDDDDFRETINKAGIQFIATDSFLTLHQDHGSVFERLPDFEKRLNKNKALYYLKKQNKSDEYINQFLGENFGG